MWIASFCFLHAAENRSCDSLWTITARKAKFEIYPSAASFQCRDTITFSRASGAENKICLKLLPLLTVRGITCEGDAIEYSRDKELITINHIPSVNKIDIVFQLDGNLSAGTEFSRINETTAIIRLDEVLPSAPHKYESVRFTVSVPSGWKSIGPGEVVFESNDSVNEVDTWQYNRPLPVLGWLCAGKFDNMESKENGILFSTYMVPGDSINATPLHILSKNIIRFYGEKFSPYRFDRLSIVEVDNWVGGNSVLAIASPSFIMVKRFAFKTEDPFNKVESILAHEIAHQWWPLTVFMGDEDIPFLSEGLCEYSARWYNSSVGKESGRDSLGKHPLLRPLLLHILRKEETPLRRKTDMRYSQTLYLKGAYVHHMLRELIGGAQSEKLYKLYAGRFAEKESHISDFISLADSLAGKRLDWFFSQWLDRTDIPQFKLYNVKTTKSGRGWETKGRIRIVGYQKFSAVVKIFAFDSSAGGWDRVTIGIDDSGHYRNDLPFGILTENKPLYVILDPSDDVLKIKKLPPKFADLRESSRGTMIVGTVIHGGELRRDAERDSAEMVMSGWDLEIIPDTLATLVDLQKGRIFLYGKPDENRIIAEVQKKFPYRFAGDSLMINNEMIMDSTLSFLQVIDNPYIQHGLLVWIAHFGIIHAAKLLPYDASWILLRGKDEIEKGVWEVLDENLRIDIP